jgi:triosephosphate isomerase
MKNLARKALKKNMNKLVAANIKMNILTLAERERYFASLKEEFRKRKVENVEIVLCPPFVHVESFKKNIKMKNFFVGVQNIFQEEKGPFTGEVSAPMAKSAGADYVILGHSDRRKYFHDTDEQINRKIILALKSGLTPIVCIGENAGEKKSGKGEEAVFRQLKGCFKNINSVQMEKIIVCYEPVWAISTNNHDHLPTSNEIMTAKLLMKKFIVDNFGAKLVEKVRIIYGGSVSSANVEESCVDSAMDGALVGKESLAPFQFAKIAEAIGKN